MTKRITLAFALFALLAAACRFGAPAPTQDTDGPIVDMATPETGGPLTEPELVVPDACPVVVPGTDGETQTNPEPGHIGLEDPYFPELGNEGYDAQHYSIELSVDMDAQEIAGTTTIDAVATKALSGMNLEFLGMQIDDLQVNGEPATYERDQLELVITFPAPVADGDVFTVAITYHGSPGEDVDLSGLAEYSVGWGWYDHGAYVAAEPTGSSSFYPVNEHPADKATYSYQITVAKPYIVAANGLLKDEIDNGDTTTFVWEAAFPMAPYLTTIGIGEFEIETDTGPDGLPIRSYLETSIADNVRSDFIRIGEMIDFYDGVFGPYPFEAAGVIVHNLDFNFSLETQTLIVFGYGFTDEFVVAHELAHQWFGDSVGLTCWQDIWLNEGFATYASSLWTEHAYGESAFDDEIRGYYSDLASSESDSDFSFYLPPPGNPGSDNLFAWSVYARGALTLHALRLKIGDQAFFDTMATYYDRYNGGNAITADFIAVAEEMSGQDLQEFFDQWLYAEHIPDIPEMGLFAEDFR
jgi:aminopeptidase N